MVEQEFISKEAILKIVSEMPDKISLDDLIDELIFIYKIEIGLEQSRKGEGTSIEDFRNEIKTWEK